MKKKIVLAVKEPMSGLNSGQSKEKKKVRKKKGMKQKSSHSKSFYAVIINYPDIGQIQNFLKMI